MSEQVRAALAAIVDGRTLTTDEARLAMGAVMDGEATPSQLAALLMGLRMRGETVDELVGFATAMRERVVRVEAPEGAIDVVGTGGDGSGTFNISTTSALVVAASGVPVAKHGNRAMTSKSGSADVLDALGIRIDHDADSAGVSLRAVGFAFLFAPSYHPAMRHAGPTRREIGVRTAFNLIGPLTNPAGTTRQLIGVGAADIAPRIAEVAARLGTERTFVIHGDGVDELPLDDSGVLYDVGPEGVERRLIKASELGLTSAKTARLAGGTPAENARMVESVLRGEPGARRDVVLLNAGAALLVAGAVERLEDGIDRAGLTIDAGLGTELLGKLREERRVADSAKAADASRGRRKGRRGDARMTLAERPRTKAGGVVHEIAARRRTDVGAELDAIGRDGLRRALAAAPPPRSVVDRLAAPGLHLIAEVKRRSPSAGDIAASDDAVARARAYASGGASVISVLCEPHWFGGSIDDLRAVRAAVPVPVLAKDFVVDPRQLDLLRAAGADIVLLLAVLHPPARLAKLASQARDLGLEPLVEAHDAREIESALGTDARLIGINNRDLRTLDVDPEQAVRLRELVPGDRLAIAESGVRDASTVARWRATGFDAALVGEALMRSARPVGRRPRVRRRRPRSARHHRRCPDAVREDLRRDRRGRDPRGRPRRRRRDRPQLRPGTPRELSIEEGAALASLARTSAAAGRPTPAIVLVTADLPPDGLRRIVDAVDPDAIQLSGNEPVSVVAQLGRPAWKALKVRPDDDPDAVVSRARAWLEAGAERILLDTAGGQYPGGTGVRVEAGIAAAVAREVPVTLAGGLHPGNVAEALLAIPATGVDVASGTDAPRVTGERPRKDPYRVALFAKRARDARRHRPNVAVRPRARAPGPARGRRRRPVGDGARLRRALRPRDAGRGPRAARGRLRRRPPRPAVLGRARRPAPPLRRPPDGPLSCGPARGSRSGRGAPPGRHGREGNPPRITGGHPGHPAVPQARGPRPYGRPQDQQRARPGAADSAAGQDAGDRGDRRGPARRRDRDRLRAPRAAVRRVHGRGGHPASGTQRAAHASARRRSPERHVRHRHPQGRRQRGDARLGHERRVDALRARVGDGPAPVPDDRARPPATDRRRGGGPAARGRGTPARHRPRLRRRRLERHRPPVALHRRAIGAPRGRRGGGRRDRDRPPRGGDRGRNPGHPPRLAIADAPGPRRPDRRGALGVGRARLPGRRARSWRRSPRRAGSRWRRRPTARRWRRCAP